MKNDRFQYVSAEVLVAHSYGLNHTTQLHACLRSLRTYAHMREEAHAHAQMHSRTNQVTI